MRQGAILWVGVAALVLGCGQDEGQPSESGVADAGQVNTDSGGTQDDLGASVEDAATDVGKDAGIPPVCTAGEAYCNGQKAFVCNAQGTELTEESCKNGCEAGQCAPLCAPGTATCSEDGKQLLTCDGDGASSAIVCDAGCDDGACVALVCEPDAVLCEASGKKLVKCAADGLSAATFDLCPFGCEEGSATCSDPACQEAATRCGIDDPKLVEICNDTRTGWDQAPEPCKESCESGACVVSACQTDETQCSAFGVEVCNPDHTGFDPLEACKSGCLSTPSGPACAICKEGLFACNAAGDVEVCSDPLVGFVVKETCSDLQQCAGGTCAEVLVLDGQIAIEDLHILLMKAFVDCFTKAVPGLCRSIDTTDLAAPITLPELEATWCDNKKDPAFLAKFDSVEQSDLVKNIMGQCGVFEVPNEQDIDFNVENIPAGQPAAACMGYSDSFGISNPNSKEVVIDACDAF